MLLPLGFTFAFILFHTDTTLRWTTIGDAHHEDLTYCGHAVDANGANGSGFDQGRQNLRINLENGGHSWRSEFWGNTQNFQQCDGDYASSDGYTVGSPFSIRWALKAWIPVDDPGAAAAGAAPIAEVRATASAATRTTERLLLTTARSTDAG
ncbi:MAG: hypothetical protein WKF41_13000 [Gaiellaceae bacterium]